MLSPDPIVVHPSQLNLQRNLSKNTKVPIGIEASAPKAIADKALNHRFAQRLTMIDTGIISHEAATKTNNISMKYMANCMMNPFDASLNAQLKTEAVKNHAKNATTCATAAIQQLEQQTRIAKFIALSFPSY
ncbi:MAG: hypothetical protein IJI35_01610 [Kiritimatiellae bacterium]|nr:hypothetical protein [Kiritimatiellia bacterium]